MVKEANVIHSNISPHGLYLYKEYPAMSTRDMFCDTVLLRSTGWSPRTRRTIIYYEQL